MLENILLNMDDPDKVLAFRAKKSTESRKTWNWVAKEWDVFGTFDAVFEVFGSF